ncbi:MAG: C69 family dipeptidase, partial [Candidatus Poribacteria bacterium]
LPNVHIIASIDLNDSDNFMGTPDIVDYAIRRGWFNPESGKPFSFRAAYNLWDGWDIRQWQGQSLVTGKNIKLLPGEQLPFSVKPDHKLSVKDVVNILRYHGPRGTICGPQTQEATVFQLRNWLPPEIGCIYWRISAEPCCGVLVPWYAGITETPEIYYKPAGLAEHLTLSLHFNPPAGTFDYDPFFAWWAFKTLQELVNKDYQVSMNGVRAVFDNFEASVFANQSAVEQEALRLFSKDKVLARLFLTDYSKTLALQAVDMANKIAYELRTGTPAGINDSEIEKEQGQKRPLEKPRDFCLSQNYPNPFNLQTTITYKVAQTCLVRLSIYALTGQFIRTLVDGNRPAGTHSVVWDGTDDTGQNVASGVYFCQMFAGSFSATRKLLLIR